MVRLDENVYEMIESRKREDETYSEAVERLIGGHSLLEIAGILSDSDAEKIKEALDEVDHRDEEETNDIVQEFE